MNAVDRLLVEWSYRCDKGYPDIDSAKDWAILNEILTEAGFSLDSLDETFRQFKFSEFVKPGRERRAETIATKPITDDCAIGQEVAIAMGIHAGDHAIYPEA